MNKHLKVGGIGILFCLLSIAVILLAGCAESPTAPKEDEETVVVSNPSDIRIMTRGFPIVISNANQNSICPIGGIKITPTNGISMVKVYIQYPGMEHLGWLALPRTLRHTDGSKTTVEYSIDTDKLMIQTYNDQGKVPQDFQVYAVILDKQ